jgi:hypothetical protein
MNKPVMVDTGKALARTGFIYIALSVGSKETLTNLRNV